MYMDMDMVCETLKTMMVLWERQHKTFAIIFHCFRTLPWGARRNWKLKTEYWDPMFFLKMAMDYWQSNHDTFIIFLSLPPPQDQLYCMLYVNVSKELCPESPLISSLFSLFWSSPLLNISLTFLTCFLCRLLLRSSLTLLGFCPVTEIE